MTLFDHAKIIEWEKLALSDLFAAFDTARNRHLVDDDDEELILSGDGADLSVVCSAARLCWARRMCEALGHHFAYDVRARTINQPVFLFTLVDTKCVRPSAEFEVDLRPIIRRLRLGLRGCDYIGVIEPGLYSHITTPGTNLKLSKCVSWHLHALVWGITREEAKSRAAKLNRSSRYVPIGPNQHGVDQEEIREREFARTLAYLLKRHRLTYRLGLRQESIASNDLEHEQFSSVARPGERLVLYLQQKHLLLPDVWIGGGKGHEILEVVKRRSRAAIRRRERMAKNWAACGRGRRHPQLYPRPLA